MTDRKAALETAFKEHDTESQVVEPLPPPVEMPPTEVVVEEAPPTEVVVEETPPTEVVVEEKLAEEKPAELVPGLEKPPQSWKPTEKAKWDKIDPESRAAIYRREREITQALTDTASSRRIASDLQQVLQPFMGRIQSMNAHPLVAVQELLKADYLLSTAPKQQRAAFVAKLITDYDVDIEALDAVLSGRAKPNPQETLDAQIEARVTARLAPFEQRLAQTSAAEDAQLAQQLVPFQDKTKYPYYDRVRDDMADIIELSAKRKVYISLETAYNKAIQLDPTISEELAASRKAANVAANAAAQRAKLASASVSGAPSSGIGGAPAGSSRRDLIASGLESAGR